MFSARCHIDENGTKRDENGCKDEYRSWKSTVTGTGRCISYTGIHKCFTLEWRWVIQLVITIIRAYYVFSAPMTRERTDHRDLCRRRDVMCSFKVGRVMIFYSKRINVMFLVDLCWKKSFVIPDVIETKDRDQKLIFRYFLDYLSKTRHFSVSKIPQGTEGYKDTKNGPSRLKRVVCHLMYYINMVLAPRESLRGNRNGVARSLMSTN